MPKNYRKGGGRIIRMKEEKEELEGRRTKKKKSKLVLYELSPYAYDVTSYAYEWRRREEKEKKNQG